MPGLGTCWLLCLVIVSLAGMLDVLAQGINVRRLKMEEIGQGHNAMVVNDACCNSLAESKMDEHLAHLLFHVGHVACQSG